MSPQCSSYWLCVSACMYVCLAMPSLLLGYTSVSVCAGEWLWGIKPWLFAVKLWVVSERGDVFLFDWAGWMGLFRRPPNCNPLFSPLSSPLLSAAPYSPRQREREGERCLGGREEWGLGSTRVDRMGTERSKNSLCMGCFTYLGFILYFGCCWKYVVLMDGNRCTPVYVLGPFLFHLYLVRNKRL